MKLCTKLYMKLYRSSARSSTRSSASGPRYIPDSLYTCLCQVYPYIATLFFTHPSFLTSSLPRKALERQPAEDCRQNQTTVARTRRPSPELDDRRQNQTTTVRTTSQRTP